MKTLGEMDFKEFAQHITHKALSGLMRAGGEGMESEIFFGLAQYPNWKAERDEFLQQESNRRKGKKK